MKRISTLLISCLLIMVAAGCGSLPSIQLPENSSDVIAATVVTQPPVDTPTVWPTTTFQFPATWTPSWVKPAAETPVVKSETPTANVTQPSKIITPLYPTGLFTIQGTTSQKTSAIPFKASTITIVWKYNGAPAEQDKLVDAQKVHKDRATSLYTSYIQTLESYNASLADANSQNNSSQVSYWTEQINQAKKEYQHQVDIESIRYQTQVGKITTTFSLQINRISVNKPVNLVTAKGLYIGQVTFKTVSAPDYYFTIVASGSFQIDITR